MPGPALAVTSVLLCAHGGQARSVAPSPRVRVSGLPVLVQGAPLIVAGCVNPTPPVGLGPCVTAQFLTSAVRVRAGGLPLLLQNGVTLCVPTGTPLTVLPGQIRVRAV